MREGLELELPERVPCAVAFLRNEERNVFLAMHGLPRPPEGVEFGRPLSKAVVRSVPLVLLADAGTRMSTGAELTLSLWAMRLFLRVYSWSSFPVSTQVHWDDACA